jgi:small neutral amino acid transporter SnatA (MarC family)
MRVGVRQDVSPILNSKILFRTLLVMGLFALVGALITYNMQVGYGSFLIIGGILNGLVLLVSWPFLKQMARGLTVDETGKELRPEEITA